MRCLIWCLGRRFSGGGGWSSNDFVIQFLRIRSIHIHPFPILLEFIFVLSQDQDRDVKRDENINAATAENAF